MNILKAMCSTCIFRRNTPFSDVRSGVEQDALAKDGYVVCHETLPDDYDEDDEDQVTNESLDVTGAQAVCHGFYARHGAGQMGRISDRLNLTRFIDPPEEVSNANPS